MTNVYFNLIQREEMARNLWVYLCTQQGVKSAKSMSAGSEAEGRVTEGRASNEHPFSIHSASIQHPLQSGGNKVKTSLRFLRYVAMIFAVLVMSIGQMWGQSFTFENSNSTTSVTTNNITYTCNGSGTSTTRFGSSLKFMNLGSGKQMQFVSTTNNISRIEIKACANNSAAKKCMTIKTSADASSYSVPSTFTATLDGSSAASVEDMSLTGTGASDWQTLVINFNANATLPRAFQILRGSNNLSVYSVKVYTAPTALATSDVTSEGVTFTVTDGASTNNYDIYYSTSISVPNSGTSASTTISSAKTKSITGLESGQTYYAWVRSTWSSGTIKGDWRPSTASVSFITESAGGGCSAPTSPSITGITEYTAGQDISLTASATGTSGTTTYTWYKGANWAAASATTPVQAASTSGATFTKASCVVGDAGTYWCNISNGTGCEVQVSQTITVAAAVTTHTVTAATENASYGTAAAASTTVAEGATTTITATPEAGYQFDHWTVSGTGATLSSTTTNPTTLTMGTANATVTAYFAEKAADPWIIKVALSSSSGATKTMSGSISGTSTVSGLGSSSPYKIAGDAAYVSLTLASGYFQAGDSVVLDLSKQGQIFWGESDNDAGHLLGTTTSKSSIHYFILPNTFPANTNTIHVGRTSSTYNGTLTYMAVYRPEKTCTAPNHVDISSSTGEFGFFGGETITLTAQAYSSAGTGSPIADANITGYQWKRNGTNISGATSKTLTISNCTVADAGDYSCVVSTGATCSTESSSYGTKVYVLQQYIGGETTYNFTRVGTSKVGTVNVTLAASTQREFKIYAGTMTSESYYMGNNGTIDEDASNWDFEGGKNNVKLNPGLGGTFIFSIDYSANGGAPKVSVTYPRKTIYLTPGVWNADGAKFAIHYFRDGGSTGWTDFLTANDCGMSAEIPQWNGITIIPVRFNPSDATPGWNGDGHVWNQTNDITLNSNNSIVITGWDASNFTYGTYAVPTYTISYNAGTGGSGSKSNETKTCGVAFTLPGSTFTYGGHTQDGWATSDNGAVAYALSGSYTTNAAQEFFPHWKCNTPTITDNGDNTVTITVPSGTTVRYTTDGSTPTSSTGTVYSSAIDIAANVTIKAIAYQTGCTDSEVASQACTYHAPAAVQTALECNTLYKVADMVPASITLSGTGQYGAGLSSNNKFEVLGDPSKTDQAGGAPEMKNEEATINTIVFPARMYLKRASNLSEGIPTSHAVKFIVGESGVLDVYAHRLDRIYLKKAGGDATQFGTGTSTTPTMVTFNVTAGTYYIYSTGGSTCVYGVRLNCCTTPTAPTAFTAGSITSTGATFSITDGGDAASYDIYYSTSSSAPTAGTAATTTSTSKTKAVTGLTANTTYYAWVRSVCDASHKSAWVALSGSSFTTSAAETPIITWEMKLTSGQNWGLNGDPSTTDNTNITSISANNTHAAQLDGKTANGTMTAGCTTAQNGTARDNNIYVEFKFHVGCDKKLTPSKISLQVSNIGGSSDGNMTYDAILTDGTRTVSGSVTPASDGTLTTLEFTNADASKYMQGDVTLRVYPYNNNGGNTGSGFRMGQYVKIFGEIANQATPAATITWTTQPANGQVGDPDFAYAVSCSDGSAVTVTSANTTYATIVGGKLHYAAAGTTHLVASATDACGNTVTPVNSNDFTVSAAAPTHDVTFSLTNVVYSSGNNQGTGAATEGSAFSTVFAASSGYSLPGTITVTIGGVEQTVGIGYTWTQGTGTLTIPAAYVTDDIAVTIVGEEMEGDGCDELVHTEAATATTLTTTVGSATLTSPSGQTANDKAIKLNSSGYIELSPKAGKSFAAGDSLIIVMWNQASSAKTTGYRIAGTDYTASMPSKVNTTFRRKLIAADIVSSKVKIERESDNGSNAYFVSAIIKHCEDLPSCTTPTLPTLSNQTVCPGSDITAWNAEPTNIATITGASEDVAYSWKKKGSDTELAATASFDLGSSATEGMAGTYVVTVTVSKTGYISKSASAEVDLTVTPATETPSITASKAKVYQGDEVVFTATCGSTGVTWQWYRCTNAGGTITGSCLSTTSSYTLASAPTAGTYYYKAVATGDGTHSCGTAEYVYTLVVSAANSCDKEFWFAKEADRPTGAASATHITGCPSGSSSASYTASIDGTNYTLTGSTGQKTGNVTIVVPADNTGTLYVVVQGSSSRTITLSKGGTQIGQETPGNSTWGVFTFDNLDAGTYTLVSSGNISWAMMALKLCPTVACTDDTPTAAATNATVCAGGTITITATGYETGATFQWQKQNASTSVWEDIDDATSATYTVTTAAAEHAGNYHIVATMGCARTSNTVTIAVPSAPVFNSFTTTRRIMETQALSISDVSATDAVSYTWYKSADATWDAGDTEIGTSKNLLKPYDGETAGSTYYVFCRATNSCGATTSSAITVTVQTLVEEDCAIVGNSGEHNTYAQTGNVSSGTYGSITERHTNSNNKYIYYTAESGYYFATATVNACVGNASDLPTAAYSYSTDGGANWTDQNLTGMTTAYADHVINLPANVNAFRVGRRLGDCGISSNTIYIHQVCFTYNENCTKTTVDPSSSSVDYEIGDSFTEPTFTVKSSGVALSPQPTITYTSSDETVATVDDDGTVNFQDKAGTVVITAAYAGDATYCDSEGSYTITVSCSDEAPKIIAADGTNIGGCNDEITLEAKKQDGTTNFSDGTYQWYRDGEAISGATGRTYTVLLTGVYSVERTSVGGCVSPSSNKATVTSESAEPEVERLTPFQYYHVDTVYAETSIMRFRHLFAVKNAGTTLEGKHFKMELSRNGGAATDVTNSNAFVMSADTVLLDLNKMYGKYEEDDELVLTCSAVDCEGNVSSIYKNTITIYVIDETPTLALICSGANGDGTRKTSNLVVGGDFLTGYNKADLCVQTGNTSFDKTQEWVLYTRLKENYIVTPVNGYAEFNKLNYEPFDILFLTDYPKASKSDAAATILDDMADLCDYRPLFTFKTHMVSKSPSKWAAKGFMAQPEVPKQSRLRLNIVCYAHPMFDDLKETSDYIQKDAGDHSQIVYTMLTGPGHEGSKGMQGFPIDAAEGFVTIGLVHYDATAADDTPSDGYVTWTPGSSDVMLVAAAERQVNLEARMILFSVNCGAQSKLTETGRQVVLKSLEYLLSDATITPVADCSFTFTNGAGNNWTYEQYKAKCPACTGTIGDGKWSTAGNWGPDWILQPGKDTEVKIAAPVTVDMPRAQVRAVRILEGGSIDIPVGSGLEVKSTIRRQDGTEISPTEVADLSIGSTIDGNGTLIFNNNAGDTKAGVAMYSKGFIDGSGNKNYQYMGTPFNEVNALYNYYGSWIYSWSDKGSGYGWKKVPNGGTMYAWTGYCITQEDPVTHWSTGTLAATGTVDIPVPADENMVVGNSWTAPIYVKEFTNDDFENLLGNVYFFNTGIDKEGNAGEAEARYQSSTYVTVPIHSSPYTGDSLISSMQGFFVKSNGSAGALHLDYDRHVRPTTNRNILSGQMHAPKRAQTTDTDEPVVLKIKVSGENYDDKLVLLGREDFSEGFDNGWDGDKWDGNESALYLYTTDSEGTENSVSAVPELEGTVIGFRAGEDDEYTMYFDYLNGDEKLYLWDTETGDYTVIKTGYAYAFTTADKEKHARFIITRSNGQDVSTDITSTASQGEGAKAKKLLIGNKMYIMVDGRLFDATGKVVK